MKILVLGAAGMAGHIITLYMKERGHDVTALARRPLAYCETIVGDANDIHALQFNLQEGRYDAVINCIGVLNKFADADPANAVFINSYLPHFVASVLKDTPTRLIQMSTDCVFAGNTGPYDESSFPDGRSYYDRTKALGEVIDEKNLTFRNSIIGPDINVNGIGLLNWFMKQDGDVKGFTGAIWTGVTTLTLAKAMERALQTGLTGLYNLVNNESISKYELLGLFNKYFRNNKLLITPDDGLQLDKTLRNNRTDFAYNVPSYEEQIRDLKEWVDAHIDIYPDYYKR